MTNNEIYNMSRKSKADARDYVVGVASMAAGSAANSVDKKAIASVATTAVGGVLAGTAIGAAVTAAAPVIAGVGTAYTVGQFLYDLFDD